MNRRVSGRVYVWGVRVVDWGCAPLGTVLAGPLTEGAVRVRRGVRVPSGRGCGLCEWCYRAWRAGRARVGRWLGVWYLGGRVSHS